MGEENVPWVMREPRHYGGVNGYRVVIELRGSRRKCSVRARCSGVPTADSFMGGATVSHQSPTSLRASEDVDLFHDEETAVAIAVEVDVAVLKRAITAFGCEKVDRLGAYWHKVPAGKKAVVKILDVRALPHSSVVVGTM
jgi:hypothetical protein